MEELEAIIAPAAPVAVADAYEVHQGANLSAYVSQQPYGLLNNDSDADQDPLTVVKFNGSTFTPGNPITLPSGAILTPYSDGSFTFTPAAGFLGEDDFDYTISDGSQEDSANVTIDVTNTPPEAVDDEYEVHQGTTLNTNLGQEPYGVLNNDEDEDSDTLTVVEINGAAYSSSEPITLPSGATLTMYNEGHFVYVPVAGFLGEDSFTYVTRDGAEEDEGAVVITVTNTAPEASADSYEIDQGETLNSSLGQEPYGILHNDTDEDSDTLVVALVNQRPLTSGEALTLPSGATLTMYVEGHFSYLPGHGFVGEDKFTYVVFDGAQSAVGVVTIDVVNQAPVAANDDYDVHQGRSLLIGLLSGLAGPLENDSDPGNDALGIVEIDSEEVTYGQAIEIASGATVTVYANGTIRYTPAAGYTGEDSFDYTVSDGDLTDVGTVTIDVTNADPVAGDDEYYLLKNHELQVGIAASGVLHNDSDTNSDALSIVEINGNAAAFNEEIELTHGTLVIQSNGTFSFTPDTNYTGDDSFTYTINDGADEDVGTVTLHVADDPVTANADYGTTSEETPLIFNVKANDQEASSGALTVTIESGPANGEADVNLDGTITYTPDENFHGQDTFVYRVTNGSSDYDTATVYVSVYEPLDFDFGISEYGVDEGAGVAVIMVYLSQTLSYDLVLEYATNDDSAEAGDDYTAATGTVFIQAGQLNGSFAIDISDDADVEDNEAFNVTLTDVSDPNEAVRSATVAIYDNEPFIYFATDSFLVNEDDGTATIEVRLSHASAHNVSFDVATSDGTALAGYDYTAFSDTLTILAGQTSTTFVIAINDDSEETAQSLDIELTNPEAGRLAHESEETTLTIFTAVVDEATTIERLNTIADAIGAKQARFTNDRGVNHMGSIDAYFDSMSNAGDAMADAQTAVGFGTQFRNYRNAQLSLFREIDLVLGIADEIILDGLNAARLTDGDKFQVHGIGAYMEEMLATLGSISERLVGHAVGLTFLIEEVLPQFPIAEGGPLIGLVEERIRVLLSKTQEISRRTFEATQIVPDNISREPGSPAIEARNDIYVEQIEFFILTTLLTGDTAQHSANMDVSLAAMWEAILVESYPNYVEAAEFYEGQLSDVSSNLVVTFGNADRVFRLANDAIELIEGDKFATRGLKSNLSDFRLLLQANRDLVQDHEGGMTELSSAIPGGWGNVDNFLFDLSTVLDTLDGWIADFDDKIDGL